MRSRKILTILNWKVISVFAFLCFGFMSCTKDDTSFNESFLYKEWYVVSVNGQTTMEYLGEEEITITFVKNGQFITKWTDREGSETETGEWLWGNDKKTILISSSGDLATCEIMKLTEDEFWFINLEEDALFRCEALIVYDEIEDGLNGNTLGREYGITWVSTPNGKGAVFSSQNESRIEYPFSMGLPNEGTIELQIKVTSGYSYSNYTLNENQSSALLFNTGPSDVWYEGAMWLSVDNTGNISLTTALTASPTSHTLQAEGTNFRFNEWHVISFSYGSEGQYISLNGSIVASNKTYTETLQACGNRSGGRVVPSVGEANSVFWPNNRYDQGFEGVLDYFRSSIKQKDWKL